jgi:hypothetical protein
LVRHEEGLEKGMSDQFPDENVFNIHPYRGNSGWSGSAASRKRAEKYDASGWTGTMQAFCMKVITDWGYNGATWQEIDMITGWGHGSISGALSNLHTKGLIVFLDEERNGASIYVRVQDLGTRVAGKRHKRRTYAEGAEREQRRIIDLLLDAESLVYTPIEVIKAIRRGSW